MRTGRPTKSNDKPTSFSVMTHVQMTYGLFSRMLAKHNKNIGMPPRKISRFFRPVKDDMGLQTPGVYSIPYECGLVYIGQTGGSIKTRLKEYHWHIWLVEPDKSAVAEHVSNQYYFIKLQDTKILYQIWLYGPTYQGHNWIAASPEQYEERGWSDFKRVMETSESPPYRK